MRSDYQQATGRMMTFKEIAEELGISITAAQDAYNNGMKKLRKSPEARKLFKSLLSK